MVYEQIMEIGLNVYRSRSDRRFKNSKIQPKRKVKIKKDHFQKWWPSLITQGKQTDTFKFIKIFKLKIF